MKIGYPCINNTLNCTCGNTFRLRNYSEENLVGKVSQNLSCLMEILKFNLKHKILFFRISSDIVPFASHPVCVFDWRAHFAKELKSIGSFIKKNNMRISMHPDKFTLINAKDQSIVMRSVDELSYHVKVLDAMGLDCTAKVQIHVGGAYGNKDESMERFIANYKKLTSAVKRRLVIENDDRLNTLKDCLFISSKTGIPVLFDVFHHALNNNGETLISSLKSASKTWRETDGALMVDYSLQRPGSRSGTHADSIDAAKFKKFIVNSRRLDFDIMLEIKNKEKSAITALAVLKNIQLRGSNITLV